MNCKELHALIPELSEDALSRVLSHENIREVVKDLDQSLRHLKRCQENSAARKDWETTRDELLAEIRRLTLRLTK
jgi:hypothetical protein